MGYQLIGDAVHGPEFQRRVRGCVIDLAAVILGSATGSGAVQDDASNDLTTTSCKNWLVNYLKGTSVANDAVVAGFLLLNQNIAAAPFYGDDAAMNWQLKHVLLTLVSIG